MEAFTSIFEIGKNVWEAAGKWFGYFNGLDDNMRNLKRKREELHNQREDLIAELISAEQQLGKRRKKEVEAWIGEVQKMETDVEGLEQQVVRERNHVLSRTRLGKQTEEKIQEVKELQEKGRLFNGLVIDAPPTSGQFIPTGNFFGETTCVRNKEEVWKYLMDEEVRRIGVYGMGGCGKTTIMHHINNQLLEETNCHFEDTIWVTVSKAFDIRKVQDEIAKALNLDLSIYEDETRRSSELHSKLFKKKRYVLILDDLWEAFPLEKVGIPEPTRSNGCKLVLTTRSFEVCRRMECIAVKVELLKEDEALSLFMSKAVEHGKALSQEVEDIARKVAKECARLPLAIITTAGSMRGVHDIREWRNALHELKFISTKQIKDNESEVFERLKFSYNRLKNEKLQNCFLYCALYPEDHKLNKSEVMGYWIVEGLIAELNDRETMLDEGHTIWNKLINTCLLESTVIFGEEHIFGGIHVRMHDLIRDMALKITTVSPRFMVHAGEGLERVPYEDWSEDLERVSLTKNRILVLPSRLPNCPRLTTLLLKGNPLSVIPDSFFKHMRHLKVLDLSDTGIKSLPKSISNLKSLHGLFLENCKQLEYVPSLGKLKALKELKLCICENIEVVPQGIEELVNLRNLNLHSNSKLQIIPLWKLSRLPQLHSLRIEGTKARVSAEDLLCFRQLKVLGAQFENVQELFSYVASQQFQNLEHYYLPVGTHNVGIRTELFGKTVEIVESKLFGSGIELLVHPSNIDTLEIERCHDFNNLSNILPKSISSNLTCLSLYGCLSIENIFSAAKLLHNFPNLKDLRVSECEHVEDIILGEGTEMSDSRGHHQIDNNNSITLPNLRILDLSSLPRLKSIYKGIMVCESLEYIYVDRCPMLRRLPILSLQKVGSEQASASASAAAPPRALLRITGQNEWWESLEWDDPQFKTTLQHLFQTYCNLAPPLSSTSSRPPLQYSLLQTALTIHLP